MGWLSVASLQVRSTEAQLTLSPPNAVTLPDEPSRRVLLSFLYAGNSLRSCSSIRSRRRLRR